MAPQQPVHLAARAQAHFAAQAAWKPLEIAFWAAWALAYFVPGANLPLMTQMLVWGLFALSLDIVLGWRGIASLGHAAFFGIGAYAAGFLARAGWAEPISGLIAAAAVAGIAGLATGRLLRGLHGVALLMVTLGLGMILFDLAVRSTDITGGDDGLQGVQFAPLLGQFRFDMAGRTAYVYALAAVFACFVAVRALLKSAWGLALLGARENERRMRLLGAPVERDVVLAFGLSGFVAGLAGALLTQTTQFVAPDVLSFGRSADVLVVLVIGGTAVLYGGFVGAVVSLLLRDGLSALNPIYLYFWIGLLLVLIVAGFRRGLLPTLQSLGLRLRHREVR
jgi:branched-chain amino acid transport system permease protein